MVSSIGPALYPNFNSMEDLGGAIILDRKPVHAFHFYKNNAASYLVLKKEIGKEGKKAIWQVIDYIVLPKYERNYVYCYVVCELNGESAPEIAVIAEYQDKELFERIVKAWKADLKSGRIIEIDTKGIICINEGYGV